MHLARIFREPWTHMVYAKGCETLFQSIFDQEQEQHTRIRRLGVLREAYTQHTRERAAYHALACARPNTLRVCVNHVRGKRMRIY